ncbi:MbtH family protein [Streptomyces sp. CRN 30]|uniref:MbtH family protein n=1 Tax=Streptomyces sp. CRN 30 TaxID=3075613 RepID=UPI002A7F2D7F|nr:MbtH family protein [Streptomyces sp. CRN 30]
MDARTDAGTEVRTDDGAGQEPFDRYAVVVNDEEQYSLWPVSKSLPAGWTPDGFEGSSRECLHHIDEVWTDLTPRSARRPAGG